MSDLLHEKYYIPFRKMSNIKKYFYNESIIVQSCYCWKATESGSSRPVDKLKILVDFVSVDSRDSVLSLLRAIRHWPEPKSMSPIRMHLSANTRNQFARYFSETSDRLGFQFHPRNIFEGSVIRLSRKDLH